ncbi:ATP-binding protein [Leucobacter insecticola]|uniref:ATP-binding protein n=1 Tax=Leucobacter insecticola TaxID=2714934 RepID=A0A6G8FII1_9MICO|nr:DUF4143 domain-containing protein [Leucobacter insecticola]QIM16161.1 ATP-binding protein [Leucobacter insecticola]
MPVSAYTPRVIDRELAEIFEELPAIALDGAKGVGKTSSAQRLCATQISFDDTEDATLFRADPALLTRMPRPILIDEWQRIPESWDRVRRAVDEDESASQFLLTGSEPPAGTPIHSGAGRIIRLRMRPMSLAERPGLAGMQTVSLGEMLAQTGTPISGTSPLGFDGYIQEICRTGLPGLQGLSPRAHRAALASYVSNTVEHEFEQFGVRLRNPVQLMAWLRAYAAAASTTTSYNNLLDAATAGQSNKPARGTVTSYRDTLEAIRVIEPLLAWSPSVSRLHELAQAPKHHIFDPGVAAHLLDLRAEDLIGVPTRGDLTTRRTRGLNLLGPLFESLATLCLRVYAQASESRVFHLRTHRGLQEIDLIVEKPDGSVMACEVKLAPVVEDSDVKHLLWLREKLGDQAHELAVISTGKHAYRRPDGIAVIPLALLGP